MLIALPKPPAHCEACHDSSWCWVRITRIRVYHYCFRCGLAAYLAKL